MKFKILPLLIALLLPTLSAHASPENDRIYQLESVACLRATDNVDGIFSDYLDEQFLKYFSNQSRFLQKKLKGLDEVIGGSSAKQNELLKQPEIMKKISQKFKIENLIRTHVFKENTSYRFVMEWVYAPKGDVLSSVEFRYNDTGKDEGLQGSELPDLIQKEIGEMIQKLPFLGQITGIEQNTITVNMGHGQGVKAHDIFTIYTLQSVKRHPLLNTIEEWRWQKVGRAQVEEVEESLSFAKVLETEPGQTIIRFQKIREVETPPEVKEAAHAAPKKDIPRIGWVAANLGIGNYSRDVGLTGGASGRTGGGMAEIFGIDSQIWLNSRFIAQASFSASVFKYNAQDLVSGASLPGNYSGSGNQIRLAGGYSLFPMKTVYDPMAWVHAGYKITDFSLPTGTSDFTADSSFGSLFVGVGGSIHFSSDFGAQLGLDLGLLRSASSTQLGFGDASSSSDISFNVAGTYHLQDQIFLRIILLLSSESMDFGGGQSVSQKMFSISPSIMYYF